MGNCSSSGCAATGLGIAQIMTGLWFLLLCFWEKNPLDLSLRWVNQVVKKIFLASIPALFITSGSLVIAGAQKKTKCLVTAAFVLSTLASLVAFGLLIYSAKVCYDAANSSSEFSGLGFILFAGLVGVPALVMFIVANISATQSRKVLSCLQLSLL